MDLHKEIWVCLAPVPRCNKQLCRLVAVPLRTLALDAAVWLDMGQRRALGMGDLSSRTLVLRRRILELVAIRILPAIAKLVGTGLGRYLDRERQYLLVSAAVPPSPLQLQLGL